MSRRLFILGLLCFWAFLAGGLRQGASVAKRGLTARVARFPLYVLFFVGLFAVLVPCAHADNPPPVQTFYIPMPEDDLLNVLQTIENGTTWIPAAQLPADPVYTYVTISVFSDNTIIYYDQWENGFETSINNPLNLYHPVDNPGGTQIWGDGNPLTGRPPGFTNDVLNFGDVIRLENYVVSTNRSVINFDAGDKIASTKPIAVTWAGWASGSATLFAGANEIFDTTFWGTEYISPVGEDIFTDIPNAVGQMFEYTGLSIMAGVGGATIQIDANADGVFETTNTLAEGEAYLVNGGVNVGGRVISDRPVQVELLTGDVYEGYESRFFKLLPVSFWTSSSTTPVSTPFTAQSVDGAETTVWLYNPATNAISVDYITRDGSGDLVTSQLTIPGGPSGGYERQVIPDGYGARFINTNDLPFYALATIDSTGTTLSTISGPGQNRTWDWGYTLVPDGSLTKQVLVGLGIGRDPTSGVNPDENGAPIWVTPIGNGDTEVTIYVDYDSDPSTGPFTDPFGNQYDVSFTARELDIVRIYNTNGVDQSGFLIYVLDDDVKLAAAWGSDPVTATAGAPGLDMGTGIPPLPQFIANKRSFLLIDEDGDGYISPGDTLEYRIVIDNTGRQPVTDLVAQDILPPSLSYISNTTFFVNSSGVTNVIPDNLFPDDPFPLSGAGYMITNEASLPVGGTWEVGYQTLVLDFTNLPPGAIDIENSAIVGGVGLITSNTVVTPLYARIGDYVWWDQNGDGFQSPGEPGINGVTVNLLTTNGVPVLNDIGLPITTVTTNDTLGNPGWYRLTGVTGGTYVVEFVLPDGYVFTTYDADGQGPFGTTNSTAQIPSGWTVPFVVGAGETITTIDAGLVEASTIGDFVWLDVNGDGIQDVGEPGLNGVTVNLLDDNGDPVLGPGNVPISTVTTNDSFGNPGFYLFDNLYAGDYIVEFVLPSGYAFTTQDADSQGVAGVANSDADPVTGRTVVFSLGVAENATYVDAGLVQGDLVLQKSVSQSAIGEGGTLFYTVSVSNAGPTLVTGISVHESLTNGLTYVDHTVSQGSYNSGTGVWTLGTLALGAVATLEIESTVDAATMGSYITNVASVAAADMPDPDPDNNEDNAVVYISPIEITKSSDVAVSVQPGGIITYTIVVTNAGATAHENILVSDLLPQGTTYVPDSAEITGPLLVSDTFRDEFNAQSYSNNDGTLDWNGDWTEGDPAGTAGPIGDYVGVSADGRLVFHWAWVNDEWAMRSADLSDYDTAIYRFDWETVGLTGGKTVSVLISTNGAAPFVELEALSGNATGSAEYDITAFMSTNTTIRFENLSVNWDSGDFAYFDNVEIEVSRTIVTNAPGGAPPNLASNITLEAGEALTVTFEVLVDDPLDLMAITNTATVTSDLLPEPVPSTVVDEIIPIDLGIEKVAAPSLVNEGSNVVFTLTLSNLSDALEATGVEVTDVLPAGFIYVSSSASAGSYNDATGIWIIGSVATNGTETLSITTTAAAGSGGVLWTNVAEITASDQGDTNLVNNVSEAVVLVVGTDLALTKTVDNPTPNEQTEVTYTISVENLGPFDTTGVTVLEPLTNGITYVSHSASQGSYSTNSGVWTIGSMTTGAVVTLSITVEIDEGTIGTSITNLAQITGNDLPDPNPDNNEDTAILSVSGLQVTKVSDVSDFAYPGSNITYTIVVTNIGATAHNNIFVNDPLPAGTTYVTNSTVLTGPIPFFDTFRDEFNAQSYSNNDGTLNWNGDWTEGDPAGTAGPIGDYVGVSADGRLVFHWAWVNDEWAMRSADLSGYDSAIYRFDWETVGLTGGRTISVLISTNGAAPFVELEALGGSATGSAEYDITAFMSANTTIRFENLSINWNSGNFAYFDNIEIEVLQTVVTNAPGGAPPNLASNVTLGPGEALMATFEVAVDDPSSLTEVANTVFVSSDEQPVPVTATVVDPVPFTDLGITKAVDQSILEENHTLVYTMVLTNHGPADTTGVEVTDVLPAGLTYVTNTTSVGSFNSGTGFWTVGAFTNQATATLTITATVDPGTAGTAITNTATITGNDLSDPNPDNDEDDAVIQVIGVDIGVGKTVSPPVPFEKEQLVYTVAVTNFGPDTATGVVITDELPSPLTYVSHVASQGTYVPGTGLWSIGTMTPMQVETLTLTAFVPIGAAGSSITNTATLTAVDQVDTNSLNNTASVVVEPEEPPLQLTKTSDAGPNIGPGDTITYTIVVTNQSSVAQTGISVQDTLPAGVTLVPGSVNIFGPINTNAVFLDRFDDLAFTNNNGTLTWTGNWIESEGDGPASGDTRVIQDTLRGPYTLRFGGGNRTLAREANLGSYTNATLSFIYRRDALLSADQLVNVQVSSNGVAGTWTTIATYAGPATDSSYSLDSFDITPYISTNTAIRFSSPAGNTPGNRVWFDDVQISVPVREVHTVSGGNPPDLVTGWELLPAESFTVTFDVTVDDPIVVTQIVNTASVVSDQMTDPVTDTVSDLVDPVFLAAVGDRVWLDENADGIQDAGEPGIPNVTIEVLDTNSVVVATTVTDLNGNYLVTGLVPGTYTVRVATNSLPVGLLSNQTYDPDVVTNHQTTVTLSMGEVYRDADFGYNWTSATDVFGGTGNGAIGDRVWIDANGDGVQDPGEPGLAGVTVTLYYDANSNGVYDALYDVNGYHPVRLTDVNGNYIFEDLPPGAYVVEVTPPAGYTQTGDPDDFRASAQDPDNKTTMPIILAPGDTYVNADFGYQPDSSSVISGTVYFDENVDENYDPDDGDYGIAGVTVALLNTDGEVIATARTDTNGFYRFTGLTAGSYEVWVNDTGYLLGGLTQTEDQDDVQDSRHTVAVNGTDDADEIDFGYYADGLVDPVGEPIDGGPGPGSNTIGGTIWEDRNADGLLTDGTGDTPDETGNGIAGVTVRLTDTNGNWVATAVTDAEGDYAFTGLPDGTYVVQVTDYANLLNGWWHSKGPDPGEDNNSQSDPYTVSVSGGQTDTTGDFGYYYAGGALGNRIWEDTDANGIQDEDEEGLSGVIVRLTIIYDNGVTNVITTVSDANGFYSFGNLLLDENHNGTNDGTPTYIISAINPGGGYNHTIFNKSGTPMANFSEDPNGVVATAIQGTTDVSFNADDPGEEPEQAWYDFGFTLQPTLAVISGVRWRIENGVAIISWDVSLELGTVGYFLERRAGGQWIRVNEALIPSNPFRPSPYTYEQADPDINPVGMKRYRIVELDMWGDYWYYGPYDLVMTGGAVSYDNWAAGIDWGDADSSPDADPDGDGRTNWQEYLAGTNPLVPNRRASVRGMQLEPAGGFRLVWPSDPGRTYVIEMTMSLDEPFLAIATGIPDTEPENVYVVPLAPGHARRAFYRVISE